MGLVTTRRLRRRIAVACLALLAAGLGLAQRSEGAVSDAGVVNVTTNLGYEGGSAAGTGMVITSSGEVLTNNHVIRGATAIRVTDPGTGRSYAASVVGYSVGGDVALLQLKNASHLHTVSIGDSSRIRVGQRVTALGNAGGAGGAPIEAAGAVTGLNRTILVSDERGASARLVNLIRINAALQPGDSGGPLLDASGHVIGMDTAASVGFEFQSSSGDGYAIPINRAVQTVRQIEAHRSSATIHIGATPFLGVSMAPSRSNLGSGPFVAGVASGSPADRAGISVGSLITKLDGHAVASPEQLTSLLLLHRAGDTVTLRWIDGLGTVHSKRIKTASGPPQ
jgi:S1-C subfamily serine protease